MSHNSEQGVQSFTQKVIRRGKESVLKISKHVDFVPELEWNAWSALKTLDSPTFRCPHFCEIYEKVTTSPGKPSYCLFFKEISLTLPNKDVRNMSLGDVIFEDLHNPIGVVNCVNQTFAAILMLEKVGITHYDLHSDNIMVSDTPFDVHVYITDSNILSLETYGITPVVIDFGVAYVPNNKLNAPTVFTDSGFTTFMSDPLVDPRLLITTVRKDLDKFLKRKSTPKPSQKTQKKLKPLLLLRKYKKAFLDNTFKPMKPLVDQKTGWLKEDTFPNIINDIINVINGIIRREIRPKKGIFHKDNVKWVLELLQHQITLPIKDEMNVVSRDFKTIFLDFMSEWIDVEQRIRNTKEEFLFLKDVIREPDLFKLKHRYPSIKNLYRLQSHLYELAKVFENSFIHAKREIEAKRGDIYSALEYKSATDIFNNIPKYHVNYKHGMKVLIVDMRSAQIVYRQLQIEDELQLKQLNERNDSIDSICALE
jgi:hypothetical protein